MVRKISSLPFSFSDDGVYAFSVLHWNAYGTPFWVPTSLKTWNYCGFDFWVEKKKWVYDAWINHKNINWPLFVCFIRQGLCALGNIIFFRSARLASMAQHHYKFSLKRALRLPQQTKKPSQNINRCGLYILPSFVMLLVLGDWSLGARNNKWWNRERLF